MPGMAQKQTKKKIPRSCSSLLSWPNCDQLLPQLDPSWWHWTGMREPWSPDAFSDHNVRLFWWEGSQAGPPAFTLLSPAGTEMPTSHGQPEGAPAYKTLCQRQQGEECRSLTWCPVLAVLFGVSSQDPNLEFVPRLSAQTVSIHVLGSQ